jgi:hypothetical protein
LITDGTADLVSANQGDNTVSVVLGNVDGGFNPPVSYATGPSPLPSSAETSTATANSDLAIVNSEAATVSI